MLSNLKPYPSYADSPGRWIPAMPSHWKIARGASVLQPVKERNSALLEETVLSLSYGRVIVKSEDKLRGLVPESFNTYQILEPGDIVVRPTDLQNDQTSLRIGHVKDHGMITSAYLGLRPSGINDAFACSYLAALDHMKIFYGMGSGLRQNLDLGDFKRLPVPVPPADEQAAIVKYLGHAHARIDRAIVAKRKLIALLEAQKQAIIHQAVTRGLDPTVPLRDSGIPWLGEIPAHWELLAARHLFHAVTRPVPDARLPQMSLTRAHGLVESGSDGTNTQGAESSANLQACKHGDFVLNKYRAHLGLFRWCREPGLVTRNYTVLTPSARVVHDFYEFLFLDPTYADGLKLHSRGVGDGMSPLYTSTLYGMKMPVPPLEEQAEIATQIKRSLAAAAAVQKRSGREIELLREFRTRLTSDVVTGQVDVREIAATLPELTDDMLATGDADAGNSIEDIAEEFVEGETD